jgi:hypothetical protein
MSAKPHIHGRRHGFSVSKALEQLGDDLKQIKKEESLSWADVGRALGKSDDRASDYANALSEMPVSAFLLGCKEWNGRFANGVLSLIGMKLVDTDAEAVSDTEKLTRLLKLAHLISMALNDLESPGSVDDDELRDIGLDALVEASRAIDSLRNRLVKINLYSVENVA